MDRLEKEEEAARLAREKQLRSSQRLQVTGDRSSRSTIVSCSGVGGPYIGTFLGSNVCMCSTIRCHLCIGEGAKGEGLGAAGLRGC